MARTDSLSTPDAVLVDDEHEYFALSTLDLRDAIQCASDVPVQVKFSVLCPMPSAAIDRDAPFTTATNLRRALDVISTATYEVAA
jgi:hypothetical protein